ncbi:hypothetical protein H6P81_019681 [Aristolochia fimbriata]|uniref:RING-type domain-containing protein n=1 Tax=Aristolochia fimbriata TaxID=158543 RepID=A0AAV7DVC9_ARIFI|nr:hypothetical protein H6P81_019681 [Aristolochia fimbriata]
MAVEAHHLNLFPLELIKNREILNAFENNANLYSAAQMGFGAQLPAFDNYNAAYPSCNSAVTDSVPAATAAVEPPPPPAPSRKRPREYFSFLGEDLSSQFQQQQQEIDQFIAQHTEKVRWELSEKRRRHVGRVLEAVEQSVLRRLRSKEEEVEKMGKLNWVLEERVKSLSLENQIWRDLARTNEATAIALRTNLEQLLAQVRAPQAAAEGGGAAGAAAGGTTAVPAAEDAESCCDSTSEADSGEAAGSWKGSGRWCRNCHKADSCVLLLPCRHLCLCTACASALLTCPVCHSDKTASVHVNMS